MVDTAADMEAVMGAVEGMVAAAVGTEGEVMAVEFAHFPTSIEQIFGLIRAPHDPSSPIRAPHDLSSPIKAPLDPSVQFAPTQPEHPVSLPLGNPTAIPTSTAFL